MEENRKKNQGQEEIGGFLKFVERVGNALPHPAMIFVILSIIVIIVSAIVENSGFTVNYFDARAGEDVQLGAVSLLNGDGLRYMFNSAVTNFTGFAPLGTVLVAMLGVAVAEHTGLFHVALTKLLTGVSPRVLTATVVFAGIMSNIASDAGYVVVIPLGAMMFQAAGRHPVAGLAAAFAGVSGGFSANLAIGSTDTLLSNISNAALEAANIDIRLDATANWYFLMASTVILTIVGTIITERVVEKNLGSYTGTYEHESEELTPLHSKALRNAGISLIIFFIVMGLLMFPDQAPLRSLNEATGKYTLEEFLRSGLITMIFLAFLVPGLAYGITLGSIKSSDDVIGLMTKGMQGMGSYLVLAFFAAQFVAYFNTTNLGKMLSKVGADFLTSIGLQGIPLVLLFILLSAFINLFMGSASAKWTIMAPIFLPMMTELGLHPALTQIAYRIGDSTTNIISPLMSYFAMILVFMKRYDEKAGLGTLISTMLPYSIAFLISWTVLLVIWIVLGLPLGPGSPLFI